MDEDILSGISPVDASVVQFAADLYNAREQFTIMHEEYTIADVFGKPKPKIKLSEKMGELICIEENTKFNRSGHIMHLSRGTTYPIGKPDGIKDEVFYPSEAESMIKRGYMRRA